MLAALKFFLGQDEAEAADSDDEGEPDAPKLVNPSKADVYKATKKVGGLHPHLCSQYCICGIAIVRGSPRIR